jgi:hypothetical protein
MQIVLNESLAVVPKLTPDQLDAMSPIFLLKYARPLFSPKNNPANIKARR